MPRDKWFCDAASEELKDSCKPKEGFVDSNLSPEAAEAGKLTAMSLIESAGRRAVSVFLKTDMYTKVQQTKSELLGTLLLECLPAFVHHREGQIAYAIQLGNANEVVNPSMSTVTVGGQKRTVLREGFLFIHFTETRVVVRSEVFNTNVGKVLQIDVRSTDDSVEFWDAWEFYAKEHSYLRGQAFFADGTTITRERKYGWDDILMPEETKRMIDVHVGQFLKNRDRLKTLGVKARRGLILSGPPGTGKTLLGKVLADTLEDTSFMWVSPRHVWNAASFENILAVARFVAPVVIFLEDLDLFAEERDSGGGMCLGELMNQLDGAIDNEDLVTIATTNRLDVIEKALRNRPGRFDRVIEMNAMDDYCRRKLLDKLLFKAKLSPADMEHLAAATCEYTGAQVQELVNTLYILCVDGDNDCRYGSVPAKGATCGPSLEAISVSRQLIDAALEEMRVERKSKMGFHAA